MDLDAGHVLSRNLDRLGINVEALGIPTSGEGFAKDGAGSATRIEQQPIRGTCEAHHGGRHCWPKSALSLNEAAVMLAHTYIGEAKPRDKPASGIFGDPHLDLRWIRETPFGTILTDRVRQMTTQLGPHERALLKNASDYSKGHRPTKRPYFLCPHRKCSLDPFRPPDTPRYPVWPVPVRAQRPADFDEYVLGQSDVECSGSAATGCLEDDEVGPAIEAGVLDGDTR